MNIHFISIKRIQNFKFTDVSKYLFKHSHSTHTQTNEFILLKPSKHIKQYNMLSEIFQK